MYLQVMASPQNFRQINPSPGSSNQTANQNLFITTPNRNPAFHPQKLTKNMGDMTGPKPPKPPEKPLMPYSRYSRMIWDQVKSEHPDKKIWEIGRIIGQMWRELPEEVKNKYYEEYEAEKVEYEKKMKLYANSPAYLAYLATKSKGKVKETPIPDEKDIHDRFNVKQSVADRRIYIQPAEDEEDVDDALSAKHVAYARYMRNNRLFNEIFSDSVVPDVRSVVTTARTQILKRQVQSLTMHQKKLEEELQTIQEKFEIKRRKLIEDSEAFNAELKKQSEKNIDEEMFEKLVQQQLEILRKNQQNQSLSALPSVSNGVEDKASPQIITSVETTQNPITTDGTPADTAVELPTVVENEATVAAVPEGNDVKLDNPEA